LTEKDFPADDYYPMGIDGVSESRSWELSKYEVSCQMTEIILSRFEDYLERIKDGFDSLQKLRLGNSTSTEALGMLKNIYDVGVLFVTTFKKYERPQSFVDDLKIYFSQYCNLDSVCGRLDEFKVRMGLGSQHDSTFDEETSDLKRFIENHCVLSKGMDVISRKTALLEAANKTEGITLPDLARPYKRGRANIYYVKDLISNWNGYRREVQLPALKERKS
jgi:hypothetical protein